MRNVSQKSLTKTVYICTQSLEIRKCLNHRIIFEINFVHISFCLVSDSLDSTNKLIHNSVHCVLPTLLVKTLIVNENAIISPLPPQIYEEVKVFLQKILISSYHLSQQINKNLRMVT